MCTILKWSDKKEDIELIGKIADRYVNFMKIPECKKYCMMDIESCHMNGNPLNLQKLLDFEAGDFLHDVSEIGLNIDRTTGKLRNCFSPRCSLN